MKKSILFFCSAIISLGVSAQSSSEIGESMGFSNYLGDLQPENYTFSQPGPAGGIFVRHNVMPQLAFRGFLNYARIQGSDAKSNVQSNMDRNLSFRSNVVEFGVATEINMLPFDMFHPDNKKGRFYSNFTPYVFGGINIFRFNPKAEYKGSWVELRPLHTEGQGTVLNDEPQYKLTQAAIPFGMGFKYQTPGGITIAIELGARKTFTDYLDDVSTNYPDLAQLKIQQGAVAADLSYRGDELSTNYISDASKMQRGDPTDKDWYLMNTISVSYKFYHKKHRY